MSALIQPTPRAQAFFDAPHRLLIGGEWVEGRAEPIAVENPSRNEHLTTVDAASDEDVDRAVAAARVALNGPWGRMSGRERAGILFRFADLLDANAEEIAEAMAYDNGQSLAACTGIVRVLACEIIRYYAGWATKIAGDSFLPSLGGARANTQFMVSTLREPIGVVAAIVPWNAPAGMMGLKLGPALATGCTVVLKTAELAPLTGEFFGRFFLEAGGPPGVLNILHGLGHETGAAMARHPGVDKISFTGSPVAGRSIVQAAAGNLKKVTLELGGKSPIIVFPDADLDALVPATALACFVASGQACMAATRLFAHADIYDELVQRVADHADALTIGDSLEPGIFLGPLISARQRARVEDYIRTGIAEGARVANRNGFVPWEGAGNFVRPIVFADATADMRIAQEEIFGPVLTAIRFDDEAAMLRDVNSTTYGLSGSVWTNDITRALRVARQVDSGQVGINVHAAVSPETPFGGNRESGWGREFGEEGLLPYLKTKAISINLGPRD
ncbi:aldehyde dehydrogenase family protein [Sphingomonas immobilis]|uniref:aldehyde dehydrogenase (NAD(+)) n=1 Tax=Sphingomonas immobilis TaxID=3063997 RepID=A0ABT9A0R3_9SPHN|nr:aldehyde dehydrogenase family protein [Sphingomonas sp. CA1-15]MDO7843414.1 aldehyde dehydrogenase family protein [Sphingomonas sp. CA1-15]